VSNEILDPAADRAGDVLLERDGSVAVVTFNRPAVLNAVGYDTAVQLNRALRECEEDDGVRAIVITGRGSSFCAGIDLTALAEGRIPRSFFALWEETMWLNENMPKPVVCAVHGNCIGAGLQLALTCDLRIAGTDARFALPATREGLMPSLSPHRLWRFVGLARARRMVLFAETWDSATALANGLVDELVHGGEPGESPGENGALRRALEQAHRFAESLPTISFVMCKRALSLPRYPDEDRLATYLRAQNICLDHPDHTTAARSWLQRARRRTGRSQ
jgi:2-(1,2-epoxy-1,2-dihydrophenyl)acetyl-CoA isomerase